MADAVYRGGRPALGELIRALAAACAGGGVRFRDHAEPVLLSVGTAALSACYQDFILLSRGGTSSWGMRWPPLKRETVAQRRVTPGERKAAGLTGKNKVRGLLTPDQDKEWRKIFARTLARLRLRVGEGEAKATAAKVAWAEMKRRGARTKLDVFGGRQVDALRDTGRLLRSLTPGLPSNPDQVLEADGNTGLVTIGTRVEYAARQFERRPVWPADGTVPGTWWDTIHDAAADAVKASLIDIVQSGGV